MQESKEILHFIVNSKFSLEQAKSKFQSNVPYQNIYLGGVDALTQSNIAQYKINAVLTIMSEKQKRKSKLQKKIEELDDINKHITLMVHDENQTIAPYFIHAIDFINEALHMGMNVLVHCRTGNDKSAAIMSAFLIYLLKIKSKAAVEIVQNKRKSTVIPQSLQKQLFEEQQKLIALNKS